MCVDCNGIIWDVSNLKESPTFLDFKDRFFNPSIQELILLFNVKIGEFYDTVHAYDYSDESMAVQLPRDFQMKSSRVYHRSDETNASYKRLNRLMSFLLDNTVSEYPEIASDNQRFFDSKIYDIALEHVMLDIYNQTARLLGYELIRHTVPEFSRLMLIPDFSLKDWKTQSKKEYFNAGYFIPIKYLASERTGFNYIEYVFLSALYTSVKSQSIRTLNQPIDTKDRRRNAKRRFKDFYDTLHDLRKEFVFVFFNAIAGYLDKQANCLIDSDGCMGLSDYNIYEWFKFVSPIAECIVDGYIPANFDVSNIEMVDCKKQLNTSKLSSLYKTHLKFSGEFLSNVPVSVYKDACCVAKLVNDIVQMVIENAPELFRGFKESCIIPDGIPVYNYMRELS